jgi:branched-chain amino acid transport system substrate-binding protein
MVEAARQLGMTRPAILWDAGDEHAISLGQDLRGAASSRGVVVASASSWAPFAEGFVDLARQVAATRPDGVLLAGAAPRNARALLRDLRSELGAEVPLLASDGFAGLSPADAEGLYVTNYGIPNAELPPAGRQFLAELEARTGSEGPDASAVYTAQAAELLLDAIARSDGSRRSVSEQLRRASVTDGLLGAIRFDEFGDPVPATLPVYRITAEGQVVDRIVTVP